MDFTLSPSCFASLEPIEHLVIATDKLSDHNSVEQKDVIRPVSRMDIVCEDNRITCDLDKYSWNVLRLKER